MQLLIVTGISGAGKSLAVRILEDMHCFCIDNIPAELLCDFAKLTLSAPNIRQRVAMVLDSRGCQSATALQQSLQKLSQQGVEYQILFLDASDDVLIRRYRETRRRHPLTGSSDCGVQQAIEKERVIMQPLFETADYIVDTSLLSSSQLRQRLAGLFQQSQTEGMGITVMSFGFKFGQPQEADLMFDVRCLPNPFYITDLKEKTGLQQEVVDFVMKYPEAEEFLQKILSLLEFSLPLYIKEGKTQLTVAVGCTGGKHRSVTFARKIAQFCEEKGYCVNVHHRDIERKNQ